METSMRVKGLISKNTIVLHPSEGEPINIGRDTDRLLFEEVSDIINKGTEQELLDKFLDIKTKIERYSNKIFTVDNKKSQMFLKGDDTPMPDLMVEKLLELEKEGEDFMPLIRFWKKLKTNPSQASINQLYGFMVHNGIGLTESGDIVVEKGVSAKNGKLVDSRTRTIDNSIGQVVKMDRAKVDDNPKQTCSHGLHVGAPEYVRDFYGGIIIKCTVNPADVVAVPTDYNNTKMRVCEYTVVGYSEEHTSHKPLFKLSDFISVPNEYTQKQLDYTAPKETENLGEAGLKELEVDAEEVKVEPSEVYRLQAEAELEGLTAVEVLDYIEDMTGERMPYNPKSKRTIVKRGIEILAKHIETEA